MEQRISIERMEQAVNLFGSFDENVRLIESEFKVTISNREGELRVNGEVEDTMLATKALNALLTLSNRGEPITEQNVRYVISLVHAGQEDRISELTRLSRERELTAAREQLFDLGTDPGERRDLASTQPQVVRHLGAALDRWFAEVEAERPRRHG